MLGLVCYACGEEASTRLNWGVKYQAYYCEHCAQSVIEQLRDEGQKFTVNGKEF